MKLKIDQPVIDLTELPVDGKPVQAKFNNKPATLRSIITWVCTTPSVVVNPDTGQRTPEPPQSAAEAYMIGLRAFQTPLGGELELDIDEAAMLKTRGYHAVPGLYSGFLDVALEEAAGKAQPPAAEPD